MNKIPANIYLFKVNIRNTKKRCEIYSKLTIKTPERRHQNDVNTLPRPLYPKTSTSNLKEELNNNFSR